MRHINYRILTVVIIVVGLFFYITTKPGGFLAQETQQASSEQAEPETLPVTEVRYTAEDPLILVLDPGHGGNDGKAPVSMNGTDIYEKDLNLAIAQAMKNELDRYSNVTVYMTRTTDEEQSLEQRDSFAKSVKADFLISLHCNASKSHDKRGASVIVPFGNFRAGLAQTAGQAGQVILAYLEKDIGVKNNDLMTRLSKEYRYTDGSVADYYGLIRYAVTAGYPALIVEHAYYDNAEDYTTYLSTEKKLAAIGKADADAVAWYFRLYE